LRRDWSTFGLERLGSRDRRGTAGRLDPVTTAVWLAVGPAV